MIPIDYFEHKAQELRVNAGVDGIFPVDINKVAAFLGFKIYSFTPDTKTSNISRAVDHKTKQIYTNSLESSKRRYFTAAHEIGHIVLHGKDSDHIDYRDKTSLLGGDPKETEANRFATELLMPASLFTYKWHELKKDLDRLSRFFGPSPTAVAIRAESLGLC